MVVLVGLVGVVAAQPDRCQPETGDDCEDEAHQQDDSYVSCILPGFVHSCLQCKQKGGHAGYEAHQKILAGFVGIAGSDAKLASGKRFGRYVSSHDTPMVGF